MFPAIKLGPYIFFTFGICVGVGVAASYFAFRRYYERSNVRVSAGFFLALVIPFGFLCARLDDAFLNSANGTAQLTGPLHRFVGSGYTYFGGLVGAFALWLLIIKLRRWPLLPTLDGLFCAGIGYAIGRIGCFMAGDGDFGPPTSLPWGVSFPHGFAPTTARVHPTMLYLTLWETFTFFIFWRISDPRRGKPLPPGTLLSAYLISTSLGRFIFEFLSLNQKYALGLTEAQWVSAALCLIGLAMLRIVHLTARPSHSTKIQAHPPCPAQAGPR